MHLKFDKEIKNHQVESNNFQCFLSIIDNENLKSGIKNITMQALFFT